VPEDVETGCNRIPATSGNWGNSTADSVPACTLVCKDQKLDGSTVRVIQKGVCIITPIRPNRKRRNPSQAQLNPNVYSSVSNVLI
jgi:hypothetical protein